MQPDAANSREFCFEKRMNEKKMQIPLLAFFFVMRKKYFFEDVPL
jgi:hypothetical protein